MKSATTLLACGFDERRRSIHSNHLQSGCRQFSCEPPLTTPDIQHPWRRAGEHCLNDSGVGRDAPAFDPALTNYLAPGIGIGVPAPSELLGRIRTLGHETGVEIHFSIQQMAFSGRSALLGSVVVWKGGTGTPNPITRQEIGPSLAAAGAPRCIAIRRRPRVYRCSKIG